MLSKATISFIRELLDEGLSNVEIARRIRRFSSASHVDVKKAIDSILDEEAETASTSVSTLDESDSGSAFEMDEDTDDGDDADDADDEDYVDEDEDEDDEDYVDESDDEGDEDASDTSSSVYDYDNSIPTGEMQQTARIYLTQKPESGEKIPDHDQIIIKPMGQGIVEVQYFYDIPKNRRADCRVKNKFTCNISQLAKYVMQVFKLVSIDQKPFSDVEIMIPYYPTTTLTPSALKKKSKRRFITTLLSIFAIQADQDLSADVSMD